MTDDGGADRRAIVDVNLSPNKIGTSIVVAVLMLLSVAAGVIGYLGWTIGDADVPTSGYVAMALGVFFSLIFGIGLMTLVFFSSRKGYDEPAVLMEETNVDLDDVKKAPRDDVK